MNTEDNDRGSDMIAVDISADRVMIYATTDSVNRIISALQCAADSTPEACHEINIIGMFTETADDGSQTLPSIRLHDGLEEIMNSMREKQLEIDIKSGLVPVDASVAPFEISIMHVTRAAVREESGLAS